MVGGLSIGAIKINLMKEMPPLRLQRAYVHADYLPTSLLDRSFMISISSAADTRMSLYSCLAAVEWFHCDG